MTNYSVFDKFKILFKTILSNPFFSVSAIFGIILAVLMILDIVKRKKISKRYYVAAWFFIFIFIATKYMKVIPKLIDNLINQIFMTLYFPSIGVYMFLLIVINVGFIYCLARNIHKSYKILSGIISIIMDLLFILIVNLILENGIDITSEITLYTNSNLLVLLEMSTALFVSWILLVIFISAYLKLKVLDNNLLFEKNISYPEMAVYINDTNRVYKRKVIPAFHSTYHN
ncbi:MAG: hypothetical protein IJR82_00945 [Bacilli bacterium]|nr:hypothetical protein [Bacilli bacterium]